MSDVPGRLYVYRDEERDAVAIARYRVGPRGGHAADTIARIHIPSANMSREELNAYALQFSAAPELLEALEELLAGSERHIFGDECLTERKVARAAIAKARGQ